MRISEYPVISIVIGQIFGPGREGPCTLVPLRDYLLSREAKERDCTMLTSSACTLDRTISKNEMLSNHHLLHTKRPESVNPADL